MESYDEETVARMGQAFLEEHPTTIRCNLNAVSKEELTKNFGRTGRSGRDQSSICSSYSWI